MLAPFGIQSSARQTTYIHRSSEPTCDEGAKTKNPDQHRQV